MGDIIKLKESKIKIMGCTQTYKCKYYGYSVVISSSRLTSERGVERWYYTISKGIYSYNSDWDHITYSTIDECVKAIELKIRELLNVDKVVVV